MAGAGGDSDDINGIREFEVGTGGYGLYDFGTIQFIPVTGGSFHDSGSTPCH